jgi:GLTT repeat (6 copies)
MALGIMTLGIATLGITTLGITTLGITTLGIATFDITSLSIIVIIDPLIKNDTQRKHRALLCKVPHLIVTLSVVTLNVIMPSAAASF